MESFTWIDELFSNIQGHIQRIGWSLMSVMGDAKHVPWCYTIGLVEKFEHPELILVGLDDRSSAPPLNMLGEAIAAGNRLDAGDSLSILGMPTVIGAVDESHWNGDWFAKWHHYYDCVGHPDAPGSALQVVWPDDAGHFPGDPGWNPAHDKGQPLLAVWKQQSGWYDG